MARRKLPELTVEILEITPTIALEWLERNRKNRKVSDRLVMIYADAIKNGEWRLNGEPIIFDYNNTLQSGQHRLLAVCEAQTPIWSLIVYGAEPDALFTLDSGRKRKLTDALTLMGEKDVANLSGAITWTWRWEQGLMDRGGITATVTTLLKTLEHNPDLRDDLYWGRRMHQALKVSAGLFASIFHALKEKSEEDAVLFFETVISGEGLVAGDPIYALRRFIINSKLESRQPTSSNYAAVTVKAWNAWREHRTVRSLVWRAGEIFPEVV